MNLSGMLTDNQIAVIGCFIALAVSLGITALSFQLGPAGRQAPESRGTRRTTDEPKDQRSIPERRAA